MLQIPYCSDKILFSVAISEFLSPLPYAPEANNLPQPFCHVKINIRLCGWPGSVFFADWQDWVIVPTALPPLPVSVMTPTTNSLSGRITSNTQLLLHPLLPPEREQHYSLRERSHNYQLPERTTQLKDKNFIIRMLYRDWLLHFFTTHPFYVYLIAFCLSFY